jgi:L-fuculokinase
MSVPVIAIFDIGKTNKKVFLFDEEYKIRYEQVVSIPETKDEDGFPCEDIHALTCWVKSAFHELLLKKEFDIRAIQVSAYGASFVHLDEHDQPVTPLYNYLKPYPEELQKRFFEHYGNPMEWARITASPVLGNLNSGMQLYWLKHAQPDLFAHIRYSLHLPEYISFLFSGKAASSITSIGCHTGLWDFTQHSYHPWVAQEGILEKLAPITSSTETIPVNLFQHSLIAGPGIHDSSAALIPYLYAFNDPFVLISTGTWSISLNPFNHIPLTHDELRIDCLCYLSYAGKPVKASRFFLGFRHDEAVGMLAEKFHLTAERILELPFDEALATEIMNHHSADYAAAIRAAKSVSEGYHYIMAMLTQEQKKSTDLILQESVKNIYVDGGFSRNTFYIQMLKKLYPAHRVCAAELPQASALGAALVIHDSWNTHSRPAALVTLSD